MQALYQLDIQGAELLGRLMAEFFREMEGDSRTRQLAWEWTSGTWAKVSECDGLIGGSTIRWQFSRLSPVDKSILRLAVYQLTSCSDIPPKVIINARTGSVVMNQLVAVDKCAIAHGNLSVTISSEKQVSQPEALSGGQTVVTEKADVQVKSDKGELMVVPASASLNDVVRALNAVGATPQDLLAILQAMKAAGALKAELEII